MKRRLLALAAVVMVLPGCSVLDDVLAEIANEFVLSALSDTIMGDEETKVTEGLVASETDPIEAGSDADAVVGRTADLASADVVVVSPAFGEAEAAERLFTAEDEAILEAPVADVASSSMVSSDLGPAQRIYRPFIDLLTFVHVPDQGPDLSFPVQRPIAGGVTVRRIVLEGVSARPYATFTVDAIVTASLRLVDGTGGNPPQGSTHDVPLAYWSHLFFSRSVGVWNDSSVEFVGRCSGAGSRCVLRPNVNGGEITLDLTIPSDRLVDVEEILSGGETPDGLGLWISNDIGWVPSGPGVDYVGRGFAFDPYEGSVRVDWRIEDFEYVSE